MQWVSVQADQLADGRLVVAASSVSLQAQESARVQRVFTYVMCTSGIWRGQRILS